MEMNLRGIIYELKKLITVSKKRPLGFSTHLRIPRCSKIIAPLLKDKLKLLK